MISLVFAGYRISLKRNRYRFQNMKVKRDLMNFIPSIHFNTLPFLHFKALHFRLEEKLFFHITSQWKSNLIRVCN